jgi:hypothetical protein
MMGIAERVSYPPLPADLIVRGRIVTMDGGRRIINDGAVVARGGHIVAIVVVRFANRGEVKATIVAGRVLYRDGQFLTVDLDRLRLEATAGAAHVNAIVEERRYKPFPPV